MYKFSIQTPVIKRTGPNAVIYNLSDLATVTITLPLDSKWTSGLHWHEEHIEYLKVIKGSVHVTLNGQTLLVSAGDAITEIKVNKGVWHEWKRADVDKEEEVIVVERTEPRDGQKSIFFWNLNGVILKAQNTTVPPYMPTLFHSWLLELWVALSLFTIFFALDNFPVFLNLPQASKVVFSAESSELPVKPLMRLVDFLVSHALLVVASFIAWLVGIQAVQDEFTPKEVSENWKRSKGKISKRKVK